MNLSQSSLLFGETFRFLSSSQKRVYNWQEAVHESYLESMSNKVNKAIQFLRKIKILIARPALAIVWKELSRAHLHYDGILRPTLYYILVSKKWIDPVYCLLSYNWYNNRYLKRETLPRIWVGVPLIYNLLQENFLFLRNS